MPSMTTNGSKFAHDAARGTRRAASGTQLAARGQRPAARGTRPAARGTRHAPRRTRPAHLARGTRPVARGTRHAARAPASHAARGTRHGRPTVFGLTSSEARGRSERAMRRWLWQVWRQGQVRRLWIWWPVVLSKWLLDVAGGLGMRGREKMREVVRMLGFAGGLVTYQARCSTQLNSQYLVRCSQ